MLRRRNLPASSHTPLTEKLGSLELKIRKEIAIMKKCRHGHVVRLLEVIDDKLNDRIYMGKPSHYFPRGRRIVLPIYFWTTGDG
jgi:[calcium/calmodulin-dependent protein kinase] kinase